MLGNIAITRQTTRREQSVLVNRILKDPSVRALRGVRSIPILLRACGRRPRCRAHINASRCHLGSRYVTGAENFGNHDARAMGRQMLKNVWCFDPKALRSKGPDMTSSISYPMALNSSKTRTWSYPSLNVRSGCISINKQGPRPRTSRAPRTA